MKIKSIKASLVTLAAIVCAGSLPLNAAEQKLEAGPKGGRILQRTTPTAEFFVERDRTVSIYFYGPAQNPLPPSEQNATVIADAKEGRQKIEFEKKGDALVNKAKLPEGDGYNLVVQLKQNAEAPPQNFRFKLDLSTCGGCKRAEYSCTCHD